MKNPAIIAFISIGSFSYFSHSLANNSYRDTAIAGVAISTFSFLAAGARLAVLAHQQLALKKSVDNLEVQLGIK